MIVETYEQLAKRVEAFENQKEALEKHKEAAKNRKQDAISNLDAARKNLKEVVARATVEKKDTTTDVLAAQARLTIAEESLRQAAEEAEEACNKQPEKPTGINFAYDSVRIVISQMLGKHETLEQEIPELRELLELRTQYLDTLKTVLAKRIQLNNELAKMQNHAAAISEFKGIRRNYFVDLDALRKWAWIQEDYQNDFYQVDREVAREARLLPPPIKAGPSKRVVPEKEYSESCPIDNIPTYGVKVLGKTEPIRPLNERSEDDIPATKVDILGVAESDKTTFCV